MLFLFLSLGFAVLAFVASKQKAISRISAIIAFLCFIVWLASGPGFEFIDWLNNPSVPTPDIDVPGVR